MLRHSDWAITLALLGFMAACAGESADAMMRGSKLCESGQLVLVKSTWKCSDSIIPTAGKGGSGNPASGRAGSVGAGGTGPDRIDDVVCESNESCQGHECADGRCGDTCNDERCPEGRLCLTLRYEECTSGDDCICRLCGRTACQLDEYCYAAESCLSRSGRCRDDSFCPSSRDSAIAESYCDKSTSEELGSCAFKTPKLDGAVHSAEMSIQFDQPSNGLQIEEPQDLVVTLKTVTGPTFVLLVGPLTSHSPSFNTDSIVSESVWAAALRRGGGRTVRWSDGHGVREQDSEWIDPPATVEPGMYILLAMELDEKAEIRKLSAQTPYIQIGSSASAVRAPVSCVVSASCFDPIHPQACIPALKRCQRLCFRDSDCEEGRCHHGDFGFPYCID